MGNTVIRSGEVMRDTAGKPIQAHGGYIFYEDGIYHWYGENKEKSTGKDKMWTYGITSYRSADLLNWEFEGFLLSPSSKKDDPLFYERRIDRPHILKNEKQGSYVLWLKYNDTASYAIFVSRSYLGPYNLVCKEYHPFGFKCGDFDFAFDDEGNPYLFVEVNHVDLISCTLSEDYCSVTGEPVYHYKSIRPPFTREGVTCFKKDGKYYLLTSGMSGYIPNPSEIAVSDSVQGPYKTLGDPHVDAPGISSYNSQVSCIFQVRGTEQYISVADRWVPDFVVDEKVHDRLTRAIASNYDKTYKASLKDKLWLMKTPLMGKANTSRSTYVILPIDFTGDYPAIRWQDEWTPEQ